MLNSLSELTSRADSRSVRTDSDRDRKKVLVVDDESLIRYSLKSFVERKGFAAHVADSGVAALKSLEETNPDIVLLDIRLPDANGLTLLKTIKEAYPATTVIMITGCADIQSTVEAMKMGALDYLEKPIDLQKLGGLLAQTKKSGDAPSALPADDFVYASGRMKEVIRIMKLLATKSDMTALVLGESGTGKSLLCKAMHELSARRDKPFVEIGCSNIPEHLMESELFGHEKGAFTDAKAMKKGLIEIAEGGTVFFDEIGDMPYHMQAKLLTLIEEKRFRRIGGLQNINADVRIFAATNRNLQDLVQARKFRLDLFYRLNVATLEMPPLRERSEDIPLLIQHYLQRYGNKYGCGPKGISEQALCLLQGYSWPGNVRELKNLIERLVILSKCEQIQYDDLPPNFLAQTSLAAAEPSPEAQAVKPLGAASPTGLSLKTMEEEYIRQALKMAQGNQRRAAKLLDITRDTLRYRLKKLGIDSSQYLS